MKIKTIKAREILDSRGNPTVETKVTLENGSQGVFGVPSGASTGVHEAWELRDKDESRYLGKGVLQVVENVNDKLANALQGRDSSDQKVIDNVMLELDGTKQKKNLGANAILSVSIATAKAAAAARQMPLYTYLRELFMGYYPLDGYILPVPMFNIVNGGEHADNDLDIQEFMVGPLGASNFIEAVRWGSEVFHNLQKILEAKGLSTNVGNEGGFAPSFSQDSKVNFDSDEKVFELLQEAITKAGYKFGSDIGVGIDAAASEFFEDGMYNMRFGKDTKKLSTDELVKMLQSWIEKYNLILVEDGLAEDDLEGWKMFNNLFKSKIQVVGDDFLVTNKERVQMAIDNDACNSVLIKVNQIGSLSETFDTVALAYKNNMSAFVSHRSGETTDTFISDLAVAINASKIKSGATSRGERVCKYNRLMEIESELGTNDQYAGKIKN